MRNFARLERAVGIKLTSRKSLTRSGGREIVPPHSQEQSVLFKVTIWTLTAAVGAAVLALQYTAGNY